MNKAHRDWVVSFLIDQWQKGRFNADLLLKFISKSGNKINKNNKKRGLEHWVFPSGHPSKY